MSISPPRKKTDRTLYLINSFSSGGAELGIVTLLDKGFFDNTELHLRAIHKGTGTLHKQLQAHPNVKSLRYYSQGPKLTILAMIKALFLCFHDIIRLRPAYLLLSLVQANLVGYVCALFFPRLKIITFFHNVNYSKKIYGTLIKRFFFRVNIVLYDTLQTARKMEELYHKRSKQNWHYIPLVSVNDTVQSKRDYALHTPVKLISVARLSPQKNFENMIRAIALLSEKNIELHYSIAGTGELERTLKILSRDLKIEDKISFLGFVDNWQNTIKDSDIFLICSKHEGLSIVTIEAMAHAMPVIATNVGGIQEYGDDEHNMLKARSTEPHHIAEAIETLIEDHNLREKIGIHAQETAHELFSDTIVRDQLHAARDEIWPS